MKRVSILFFIAGFLLCGSGIYLALPLEENTVEDIFDYSITVKEKDDLTSYLTNKYNSTFEILSRKSRYCITQRDDADLNYIIDSNCDNNEIIVDIFNVRNKDNLEFYVKKVSIKDNKTLLPSLSNYLSKGFYDNYLFYYLTNKYSDKLLEKFDYLDNITNQKIYYGLGIENDLDLNNNKNATIYLYLGKDTQNVFNLDTTFESFLSKSNELGLDFNIGFYIKTNMDIDSKNFQSIIKSFVDNDSYNFEYGIKGDNIIIEFNDKRYLSIKNGYLATLYEYKDNVFENDSERLYENSILLNNDPFSKEGITLNQFMDLEETSFKF